jgi:hypothetical protein
MTDDEITTWLETDEHGSRPYRAQRMRLLLELFGENANRIFFGGVVPLQAFEEMRLAYLHGLYVSCVVVSQIVIEHILAGLFEMFGRQGMDGAGFQRLVEAALHDGFISQDEYASLDQLRRLRNPYTHSKPIMHETGFIRRSAETGSHPEELFQQDAELALTAVSRLLKRRPFSFPDE